MHTRLEDGAGGGEWFTHVNIRTENSLRVPGLGGCKRREMAGRWPAHLMGVAVVQVLLDFILLKVLKSNKLVIPK